MESGRNPKQFHLEKHMVLVISPFHLMGIQFCLPPEEIRMGITANGQISGKLRKQNPGGQNRRFLMPLFTRIIRRVILVLPLTVICTFSAGGRAVMENRIFICLNLKMGYIWNPSTWATR